MFRSQKFKQTIGTEGGSQLKSRIVQKIHFPYNNFSNYHITLQPFLSAQNLFEFIDDTLLNYTTPIYYHAGTGKIAEG